MRAREFITEVFDLTSPKTDWNIGNNTTFATWRDKTGATVTTNFLRQDNTVDVSFTRTDSKGMDSMGRTNNAGGSSSSVFGGVAANVKDYLAKNPNVTHVTFGASDDPERSRLYSKIAQRAGALGLELVDPRDRANIPPEIRRLNKARVYTRALNMIPTLPAPGSKNTLPPPPASITLPTADSEKSSGTQRLVQRPYTDKYDQFILKRQGLQNPSAYQQAVNTVADIRKGMGKAGSNEYANVYPAVTTKHMDKQYIRDLEAELAKTPDDADLTAELARMNKRVDQADHRTLANVTRVNQ
jgi:hypothetical protein